MRLDVFPCSPVLDFDVTPLGSARLASSGTRLAKPTKDKAEAAATATATTARWRNEALVQTRKMAIAFLLLHARLNEVMCVEAT